MPLIDLNGLGHFKDKENAMVADAYSASKTYAVGDYVYYNGTLYRCTTAITTTEAWTSGHWTAAKIGDDVTELKTALTLNVVEEINAKYRFCQGGFNRNGGALTKPHNGYYLITGDFIQPNVRTVKVNSGYKITCMVWNKTNLAFAGFMDGLNHFTTTSSKAVYYTDSLDFDTLRSLFPDYVFRVELAKSATASGTNTVIVPDEAEAVTFVEWEEKELRDYYADEMGKTIKEVQDAITEPSLVFPLVTDIHYASNTNMSTLFNVFANNLNYFCDKVNCNMVANLGDNTDGDIDKLSTVTRGQYMSQQFFRAEKGRFFFAIGNHDTNYYQPNVTGSMLNGEQYFSAYLTNIKNVVFDSMSEYPLNYYCDIDDFGIRVIVLDSNYMARYTFSQETAQWLSNYALDTDNMVVLLTHLSPISTQNWEGRVVDNSSGILTALNTFINNGGKIIQFSGHSHADYYFASPWLSVFNGCQKLEQVDTTTSDFAAITGYEGSIIAPSRTRRTATEDLWSVCVLKPLSGELDVIRFGAGANRLFHYEPTTVTTTASFTSKLTGTLTWTTGDASVATVSDGTVTAVGSGSCQITTTDTDGNFETWAVSVA